MQKYIVGVVVFGILPVFYCIIHYMNDVIDYIQLDEDTDIEDTDIKVWQVILIFIKFSIDKKKNYKKFLFFYKYYT